MASISGKELSTRIGAFVEDYRVEGKPKTKWRKPLVAFADATDPLFQQLKSIISPSHALPTDLLPGAKSVIAFFIPFKKSIAKSNIKGELSSLEWKKAYIDTNQLIIDIYLHTTAILQDHGFTACGMPPSHNYNKQKLISYWSHRHIAYIAGLGKFGLHNMFITESGCAGRLGSTITDAVIPPTPRSDQENCHFKHDGSCGHCVQLCVNGSLSKDNFDRFKCYDQCQKNEMHTKNPVIAGVCGKCMVGIPCSFKNPVVA